MTKIDAAPIISALPEIPEMTLNISALTPLNFRGAKEPERNMASPTIGERAEKNEMNCRAIANVRIPNQMDMTNRSPVRSNTTESIELRIAEPVRKQGMAMRIQTMMQKSIFYCLRFPARIAFHQPANIAASTVSKTVATSANCIGFMAHNNPRPSRLAQMPFATRAPYPINGPSQNHPLHAKARTAKIIQAKYCRETP